MLQLFKGLGFDLSYSFACYAHHLTDFFKGERAKIARNPCAVEKGFILQTPLTGGVIADFSNELPSLLAFVKSIQSLRLLHNFNWY